MKHILIYTLATILFIIINLVFIIWTFRIPDKYDKTTFKDMVEMASNLGNSNY